MLNGFRYTLRDIENFVFCPLNRNIQNNGFCLLPFLSFNSPNRFYDTTFCDKVFQWLATGRWFSPGTPVSSTNKTDHYNITEILLKVALNTINQAKPNRLCVFPFILYYSQYSLCVICFWSYFPQNGFCVFNSDPIIHRRVYYNTLK